MQPGTIAVRLKPRASQNCIKCNDDGSVTICVTSPPVNNKANEHCMALLAKKLGCSKQSLSIRKGEHHRSKVIACNDLSTEAMLGILADQSNHSH